MLKLMRGRFQNLGRTHHLIFIFTVLFLLSSVSMAADYSNKTCRNLIRGEYKFGEGGDGCDLSAYSNESSVISRYQPLIFDRAQGGESERQEYVTNIVGFLDEVSLRYLERRLPNASSAEKRAWIRAIKAKGHQETYLSHYRDDVDGKLKLVTGDSLASYGMMQIHKKWHSLQGTEIGVDLTRNVLYALDHYFDLWQDAKRASCVRGHEGSALYFERVARSAYSSYNGGSSQVCRWTNAKDRWAQNDRGYYEKWSQELWLEYLLASPAQVRNPVTVNIDCVMEGGANCFDDPGIFTGLAFTTSDQRYCMMTDDQTGICFKESRTLECFIDLPTYGAGRDLRELSRQELRGVRLTDYEHRRTRFCQSRVPYLFAIGTFFKAQKSIAVREEPEGRLLTYLKPGQVYQVLDFEVERNTSGHRYYKVRVGDFEGYVYAGHIGDWQRWAIPVDSANSSQVWIPRSGETIEVVKSDGIPLKRVASDTARTIAHVPAGEVVTVESVWIAGNDNATYLQVKYRNRRGWIYAGHTYPMLTIRDWVKIVQ